MQCYQHCANQAKVQSGLAGGLVDWLRFSQSSPFLVCWLLVVHAIANKYAYTRCGTHKKNTFNSQFSRINTQTTRRVRIGIRFQFQFQRSTDNLSFTFSFAFSLSSLLALSFSLAGLFSKLIVNSFYVVFFRI